MTAALPQELPLWDRRYQRRFNRCWFKAAHFLRPLTFLNHGTNRNTQDMVVGITYCHVSEPVPKGCRSHCAVDGPLHRVRQCHVGNDDPSIQQRLLGSRGHQQGTAVERTMDTRACHARQSESQGYHKRSHCRSSELTSLPVLVGTQSSTLPRRTSTQRGGTYRTRSLSWFSQNERRAGERKRV